MKKNLFVIVLGLLLVGCKSASFKESEKKLELDGNPTTGYTWVYSIGDESVIQVSEDVKYLGKNGIVGAPSRFTYTIKSKKAGSTSLKFVYKRPWEEKDAETVRLFEVKIEDDGKLELIEKK